MRRSGSIARNSAMNLGGFTIPLIVGLVAVPVITRELGAARFGLLSLAFAILEYSSLFDMGLGAATTREVSASLARKDDRLSQLIVGSVASQAALGTVGSLVLLLAAPLLVDHVFVIPSGLRSEAVAVFRVLALMIPPTIVLLSLRGILEAAQRFDLSNAIRIPSSVATFLIPAVAASAGFNLPEIVMMLLITRIVICAVMASAVARVLSGLSWQFHLDWSTMRPLFVFGGWMSVSNVVGPMLVYLDRFMLGALIGVAAVGYYTAPFDGIMRLLIIPTSLMGAVYPAVSAMAAVGNHDQVHRVYSLALRKTALLLIVPALVLGIAGPWLLRLWLGSAFASEGSVAIRILAFGVFVNAIARVPSGFLNALGRPDMIAKLHVAELLFHVPLAWFLISRFGVAGAALAWSIRVTIDAGLLSFASSRVMSALPRGSFASSAAVAVDQALDSAR
jgi:O-antigen/teichoic acid export membrane protein